MSENFQMTFKAKNVIKLFESLDWMAVDTTLIISSGKIIIWIFDVSCMLMQLRWQEICIFTVY